MAISNVDEFFAEQFPLCALDDFLVHQTPDPIRIVASSDPRFFECYWCVLHDDTGELMLALGGSFYPNLDRCEAYAIVTHRGEQRSVRAFRKLGADRTTLHVGPMKHEIVRGMREWRFCVDENEWGLSLGLKWTDTRRQIYHAAWSPFEGAEPACRQSDVTAGFEGFGVAEGWVGFGDPRPRMGKVKHVERRLRFEDETRIFKEGEIDFTLDDGAVKRVSFRRLGFQTTYMRCGMYGGTPESNIFQGSRAGGEHVEGDCYDLRDLQVRRKLSALNEHHCEIRCDGEDSTGILHPLEPDAYEACAQGKSGWRFL